MWIKLLAGVLAIFYALWNILTLLICGGKDVRNRTMLHFILGSVSTSGVFVATMWWFILFGK